MKLATILPVAHQDLEAQNNYHMALAHLVPQSREYAFFFANHAAKGDYVIMDNGVVEGDRRSVSELVATAEMIDATEVILPDEIGDTEKTLEMGREALDLMVGRNLMAVPQGDLSIKWSQCLYEMLQWPVTTIGITKFIYLSTGMHRQDVLARFGQEIVDAGKQIHLLGSPDGADELRTASDTRLVRGADSGYPSFCAAGGAKVRRDGRRPDTEVNWLDGSDIDRSLMEFNYHAWRLWIKPS